MGAVQKTKAWGVAENALAKATSVGDDLWNVASGKLGVDRNKTSLVHMSQYADEIIDSGKLGQPGDIFAGPASNANSSGLWLTLKTGLSPHKSFKPVIIPQAGEAAFSKVIPVGIVTGWQRIMGHRYTARGILDIKTGEFMRTGVNWGQFKNYSADIIINTAAVITGFSVWKKHNE
jgi:hypothetical protein